eukprot:TRINITY_DN24148_c0_g1_i1.p2 TRINITY_DN24148_c0_g1~~TRINITY_DN24148_c0_g1_i1.p2  ORF type:complete len:213 (-),score=28.78 TRINITY_DN24148_c0_g1_i1:266-904(-)
MMRTLCQPRTFQGYRGYTQLQPTYSQLKAVSCRSRKVMTVRFQASSEDEGTDSEFVSGEWPVNWSLVSMEDCNAYYIDKSLKEDIEPHYKVGDIMDTEIVTAESTTAVSALTESVKKNGCVPVISTGGLLLGVIFEDDLKKGGSKASDIMQKPIAGKKGFTVAEAACLMLKHKVSSLPVVDEKAVLLGLVNSVDIFQAMEIEQGIKAKAVEF